MNVEAILAQLQKVRRLPPAPYLHECFELNLNSGLLTWKKRPESHFKARSIWLRWNKQYPGRCACIPGGQGYDLVCVDSVRYKAHRVVFAMANGFDPGGLQIDHINQVRSDNRPENLRLATQSQNTMNFRGARKDSTHGIRGITYKSRIGKWEASVHINGRRKYLGVYASRDEAADISAQARRALFGSYFPG